MWTNLGYWLAPSSASPPYGLAARELALRVGRAAQLRPDDVVTDYACGYGDSLRLWTEEFGVRRVVGVEPDPTVCSVAESRVREWGLSDCVRVHCFAAEHVTPRELDAQVTAVVSVDAAYHFRSRADWLRSAAASLPMGGRVAFSDLLWTSERPLGALATFVAQSMRIHAPNLLSESALQAEIRSCGLELLSNERCGEAVLDGFARHAPRGTLAVAFTRALIKQLRRRGSLDYAVTAAIQPIAPRSAIRD
jgi:cyclopropane fatty-acyl-phospholipid synthase-like methyltransferase